MFAVGYGLRKNNLAAWLYEKFATSAAVLVRRKPIEYVENVTDSGPVVALGDPRCVRGRSLREVEAAHANLLKCGVLDAGIQISNDLIEGYTRCGRMDYAFKVFDEIPLWNTVAWTSDDLIGNGCPENDASLRQLLMLRNPGCLRSLTIWEVEVVHSRLLKSGIIHSDESSGNNLVEAYAECGHVDYAFNLLQEFPFRNSEMCTAPALTGPLRVECSETGIPSFDSVAWNLMLSDCNKRLLYDDCWMVFVEMHRKGVEMDEFSYGSVLSSCSASQHAVGGEQVYGFLMKNGFFSGGYVRAGMIDLFARCYRIQDCIRVLHDIDCVNVVCWNSVVSGAVRSNNSWVALEFFSEMHSHDSLIPNAFTFSSVFTACAALKELEFGESVHGLVTKSGDGADIFVGTSIVDFYAKCGSMYDAVNQFRLMPERNIVSWSTIIAGFSKKGDSTSAVCVLKDMQKLGEDVNKFTVSSALAACAYPAMIREAVQIHGLSFKRGLHLDPVVKATLINTYSKAGRIDLSEIAFSESHNLKQSAMWSTMISAFSDSEQYDKAVIYFRRMVENNVDVDSFSASIILSITDCLYFGRQVHCYVLKTGVASEISVGSSIFTMYSKCGSLENSVKAFELLESKDYVSWTSMIAGFVEHGFGKKAIELFQEMRLEGFIHDEKLLSAVMNACSVLDSLKLGKEVHGFTLRSGFAQHFITEEALVNMYSKCGDLESASVIFHMMPYRSQVARSSLISGLTKNACIEEAVKLAVDMLFSETRMDAFSISSIISALAISRESCVGPQFHGYVIKAGLESESYLGSSLVMMYSNFGTINECRKVFEKIIAPDLAAWMAMIVSYGHHGKASEALKLFELMKKSGIVPDAATFVGVLSACSHSGLVEEGYFHLNSMITEFDIKPGYKHYICMVDLLGRAGRIEEAKKFILTKPLQPIALEWETLLAACRVHGHNEVAKLAAEKIMELQPADAGAYVSVSNICAKAGDWEHVLRIRDSMKRLGLNKMAPGWSYV